MGEFLLFAQLFSQLRYAFLTVFAIVALAVQQLTGILPGQILPQLSGRCSSFSSISGSGTAALPALRPKVSRIALKCR